MNVTPSYPRETTELAETILKQGYGTFTRHGETVEPTEGYAVGGQTYGLELHSEWPYLTKLNGIRAYVTALPVQVDYVGAWTHDGTLYLDATTIVSDRDEAVRLGKERKQIAIYDFATGEDIQTS